MLNYVKQCIAVYNSYNSGCVYYFSVLLCTRVCHGDLHTTPHGQDCRILRRIHGPYCCSPQSHILCTHGSPPCRLMSSVWGQQGSCGGGGQGQNVRRVHGANHNQPVVDAPGIHCGPREAAGRCGWQVRLHWLPRHCCHCSPCQQRHQGGGHEGHRGGGQCAILMPIPKIFNIGLTAAVAAGIAAKETANTNSWDGGKKSTVNNQIMNKCLQRGREKHIRNCLQATMAWQRQWQMLQMW